MIKKIKGQYAVLSGKNGYSFGRYQSKVAAQKRLRQIEFFKHLRVGPRLRTRLRKKSLLKR